MPRERFELHFPRLYITNTKCSHWLWWSDDSKLKVVGVIQLLLVCNPKMLQLLDLVCRMLPVYKQLQLVGREEEGSVCLALWNSLLTDPQLCWCSVTVGTLGDYEHATHPYPLPRNPFPIRQMLFLGLCNTVWQELLLSISTAEIPAFCWLWLTQQHVFN